MRVAVAGCLLGAAAAAVSSKNNNVELSSCAELAKPSTSSASLPCLEVPKCSLGSQQSARIELLSSGESPVSTELAYTAELCYDEDNLRATWQIANQEQTVSLQSNYPSCNSGVFNLDVMEMFVSPGLDNLHCYSELDISMSNVPFFAGIYNPNLNHTGIVGTPMDCAATGIQHSTSVSEVGTTGTWSLRLEVPIALLQCPVGCPASKCQSPNIIRSDDINVFRVNFYRINVKSSQVMQTQKCNEAFCDYLAWSPTMASPPSFHEPLFFGYMILV